MDKNKVFESDILQIYHYPQENILEMVWTSQPDTPREKIREACWNYLEQQKKYQSPFNITNTKKAGYVIVPEDQEWINTHITLEAWASGVRAAAYVMPSDFFMSLSVEQLSEEAEKNASENQITIKQQFFSDTEEAIAWLLSLKEKIVT